MGCLFSRKKKSTEVIALVAADNEKSGKKVRFGRMDVTNLEYSEDPYIGISDVDYSED